MVPKTILPENNQDNKHHDHPNGLNAFNFLVFLFRSEGEVKVLATSSPTPLPTKGPTPLFK